MSDVGLALAQHLAERGAGRIWLLGRHLPEAGSRQEEQVEKIRAAGCDARPLTCDVTDFGAMKAAFGEMTAQEDMPIRGVFHLAGFLDDDAIEKLTWDRFNAVLSPKVDGSWFLNELTRDMHLDHFVVFSSIASSSARTVRPTTLPPTRSSTRSSPRAGRTSCPASRSTGAPGAKSARS